MRKIIAATNMTLDGYCDHTALSADGDLHQHYNDLLINSGTILYGRITYQLMESSWPAIVKNPTGIKPTDDFAKIIQDIPKIVFSRTLRGVEWENSLLAGREIEEEISELSNRPGGDILVGSRSLIVQCMNLNLIDEYQICVHPVVAGGGLPLFKDVNGRLVFKLLKTKTFNSGVVTHYYRPVRE